MRIKQIKMVGFGKWQNTVIDFDSSLQLIYGENEAGKSTLFQFIRIMLFGFPRKNSSEKMYEPADGQIHGGQLVFEDSRYAMITVERYRNQAKGAAMVLLPNGQKSDEKHLQEILHPLTKELFDEIFSFQLEDLLKIRKISEDQLQHLLLTIGLAGSQKLMTLDQQAKQKMNQLFKPNGKIPVLNQKLTEYQQLLQLIAQKESVQDEYIRMQQKVEKIKEKRQSIVEKKQRFEKELTLFNQQLRLWPLYEEYIRSQETAKQTLNQALIEEDIPKLLEFQHKYQFLMKEKENWQLEREQSKEQVQNPALAFYLENEQVCQQILSDQMEVEKLTEKLQWYERSISKKEFEKDKLIKETPGLDTFEIIVPPEVEIQEVADWFEKRREIEERINDLHEQQRHNTAEKTIVEGKLNGIESQHPRLVGKNQKKNNHGLILLGGFLALLGVAAAVLIALMPAFQNFFSYALCLVLFGAGALTLVKSKGENIRQVEELWWDYLNQLDTCQKHQETIETELAKQEAQQDHLEVEWYRFVGKYGFSEMLKKMNWHQWVPSWYRWIELDKEQQELLADYQKVKSDLKDWEKNLSVLRKWLPLGDMPTVAMYRKAADFIHDLAKQKEQIGRSDDQIPQWMVGIQSAEKQLSRLLEEVQPLLNRNHLKDLEEFSYRYPDFEKQKIQLSRAQELARELDSVFDLSKKYRRQEVEEKKHLSQENLQKLQLSEKELSEAMQPLNYEINLIEMDGTLSQLYQEKADQWSQIEKMASEWIQENLKSCIITDLLSFLSEQQLPALLATASNYLQQLTQENYQKCVLENGELQVLNKDGKMLTISQLSTGTQDQLYVALRFAFIFLHHVDCPAPIIIDDGWLHYDQNRKQSFFQLLEKLSQEIQVLCLSSDRASLDYFQKNKHAICLLDSIEN